MIFLLFALTFNLSPAFAADSAQLACSFGISFHLSPLKDLQLGVFGLHFYLKFCFFLLHKVRVLHLLHLNLIFEIAVVHEKVFY